MRLSRRANEDRASLVRAARGRARGSVHRVAAHAIGTATHRGRPSRSGRRGRGVSRIVCVVEGKGEVEAIPTLIARLLVRLSVTDLFVDQQPVRQPRGHLVDERVRSPRRPARAEGLDKALRLALKRRDVTGVVVMCDSDDDCPAVWGPSATALMNPLTVGFAVMAVREFETWLLHGKTDEELRAARVADPDRRRNAKAALARIHPGYLPTTHQRDLTRALDLDRAWSRSDSFDKLVRGLAAICRVTVPPRPPL